MKILANISRLLVALVFLFSGFVKGVDPLGTAYRIEDYFDERLNTLLSDYFKRNKIPEFEIKDINLQIIGNFKKGNR